MTARLFVFDTGPMLCFGGLPGGAKLLAGRYHGRAWTTGDVDRELRGLCHSPNPVIASGAGRCVQKFGWIARRPFDDTDDLEALGDLRIGWRRFSGRTGEYPRTAGQTSAAFDGCQKLKRGFMDIGDIVQSPKHVEEAPAA